MLSPWIILIVLIVLLFGLFLHLMGVKIIENEHQFLWLVVGFLILYVVAVIILKHYVQLPQTGSDVSGFMDHLTSLAGS